MKIKRILNPVAQENTYILENESASLVIDPGSNTSSILAKLEAIAKPVAAILLTHTHYDHIMSVEAMRRSALQAVRLRNMHLFSWFRRLSFQ